MIRLTVAALCLGVLASSSMAQQQKTMGALIKMGYVITGVYVHGYILQKGESAYVCRGRHSGDDAGAYAASIRSAACAEI